MFLLYACVYIVQLIMQLMIMQALRAIIKKNRTKSEIFLEALRTQLCIFAVIKALSYPFLLGLWLFKTV